MSTSTIRFNKQGFAILCVTLAFMYLTYSWHHKMPSAVQAGAAKISLQQVLCAAIEAAEAGGRQVVMVRQLSDLNEKTKGKTKEGVKDMMTDGDLRSHDVMYGTLTQTFPSIKVVSEEHRTDKHVVDPVVPNLNCPALKFVSRDDWAASSSITIWIDPLDATKEYTENLLQYVTTMVCVAVDGRPMIGVIHKPFEGKTYWGWVRNGISEELETINNAPDADKESFVISRSHTGAVEQHIRDVYPHAKVEKAGGAGYKSLRVAGKQVGAYMHSTNIKKWDVCPGHAIINALGGQLKTLKDEDITYHGTDPPLIEGGLLASLNTDGFYAKLSQR